MFKKIVETIVGGAIGLMALYVVAKVAYSVGQEMAEVENHYNELRNEATTKELVEEVTTNEIEDGEVHVTKPVKGRGKLGMLMGLKNIMRGGKQSVMGDLVNNPENHKLEAYIAEGEVHIDIKKRKSRGGM